MSEVRLDVERLVNEVLLTVKPGTIWACPHCHNRMHIKEWRTCRWRHLDSCQFQTVLEAAVPVVECSEAALNGFWEWLGPDAYVRIKAVSMDMGQPYQNSTRRHCANADLIFDPFHLMKMLNKAVDEVRRLEILFGTRAVRAALKQTRQMWLWCEENLPERHAARFEDLKRSALRTARAWSLKELWRTFKSCLDVDDATVFLLKWYALAMRPKLEPVKKVARTFKAHLAGIVSIFKHGFCNALAEGINSRIQLLMQKSCGYRNRQRPKTDILFHFGGLDMNRLPVQ